MDTYTSIEGGALGSYWIIIGLKKGGVLLCGPWAVGAESCNSRLRFVPRLSSACGCRERLVLLLLSRNFQSWGQAQKSKMTVMFNEVTGLLSKWCHDGKWLWLHPFTRHHILYILL